MNKTKSYKLPERYELLISENTISCKIKDLQRNVISTKSFFLSELPRIISDYESMIEKLKTFASLLNEDNDIEIIIRPGSKYILYYKGIRSGKYFTILDCIDHIKSLQNWYKDLEIFNSKVNSLNNREEVTL